MIKPLDVSNPHADHEESIERIVKILGRSRLRLSVFNFIYGRGSKLKSVTDVAKNLKMKSTPRQSVLNEINYLAKHKVLSKALVPASKRGGKELAYGKIDFVMANKQEILRKLKKPELLEKTPTKRRPQISSTINVTAQVRRSTDKASRSPRRKLKVLYLTAAPASQPSLRTEAEFRSVQNELRGSIYRNNVELIISPAANAKSILDGINDHRPHIIHFSGHGGGKGIWLDDGKMENSVGQSMSFDLLGETLGATSSPPTMLVLNACDTLVGADVLLDAAKVVIAMSDSISDIGAATFAAQFYAAIASAQPIAAALRQGKIAMKAATLSDSHLPKIIHRKDVDPKTLVLVGKR